MNGGRQGFIRRGKGAGGRRQRAQAQDKGAHHPPTTNTRHAATITTATSDVGPHISNRRKAYHGPTIADAEYMLLRTQFFKKDDKKRLERVIKRHKFQLVEAAHGLELYVRDFEAEKAEAEKAKARDEEKKRKAAEAAEAAKAAGRAPLPEAKAEPPDNGASSGDDEQPVDPHAPPKTEKKPEPPPSGDTTDGDPAN